MAMTRGDSNQSARHMITVRFVAGRWVPENSGSQFGIFRARVAAARWKFVMAARSALLPPTAAHVEAAQGLISLLPRN